MRRPVLVAILAGTLLFTACSDQPTEVPSRPESPQASPDVGTTPCTLNQLIDLAAKLFPAGPRRTAIVLALKSLPQNRQLRLAAAIKRAGFGIIDLVTRAYTAGLLVRSADTPANLLAFIQGMYCFVPLGTPPPTPAGPIDPNEFATAVITQNSGAMNVVAPSGHGGMSFQAVTLPDGVPGVTVFVRKLPDSPAPLFTSLDQYPLFYEFSAFPDVTFTKDLIAGVCQGATFDVSSSLRLAHNVGPNFGDVKVLPFADPGFLNCNDIPGTTGFLGGVRDIFASVFLPVQLHAANSLLVTPGTGGNLKHLSPFGSVEPNSNPASISKVDQSGVPTDGQVDEPGLVYVKATSENGTPIQNVPVTFDGETTVSTDEDGIASFEWDATPGTSLTATVPNEDNEETPGAPRCPSDIPSPGPTDEYRPLVCFTPSSVTFTAPAPIVLSISAGNNQEGFANQILTAPLVVQATRNGSAAPNVPITFQVNTGGGSIAPTTVATNAGFAETNWTLGSTTGTQTATASTPGAVPVTFTATAAVAPPARIVLQWGTAPSDLDFHLTGPLTASESRFHVYWQARGNLTASPFAALDRDDVDGVGPETITISQLSDGLYRFSVHDFTNRLSATSSALGAQSAATVTLYLASSPTPQVFTVPNAPGTLWTVFELTVSGATRTVTLVDNPMGFTSDFSGGPFLRFGPSQSAGNDAALIGDATARHPK